MFLPVDSWWPGYRAIAPRRTKSDKLPMVRPGLLLWLFAAAAATASEKGAVCEVADWRKIAWEAHAFHPVIHMPPSSPIMDLTGGPRPHGYSISDSISYGCSKKGWGRTKCRQKWWAIGRWCERRPGMYGGAGSIFDDASNCLEGFCGAREVYTGVELPSP